MWWGQFWLQDSPREDMTLCPEYY